MAHTIEKFPELPTAKYPWDEWLNAQPWVLTPDVDFTAKVGTFQQNARHQAQRRGGVVRFRTLRSTDGPDRLVMQFQPGLPEVQDDAF